MFDAVGAIASTTFRVPKRYEWQPKEDITTYELALCVSIITRGAYGSDVEDAIIASPENVQRHFQEAYQKEVVGL